MRAPLKSVPVWPWSLASATSGPVTPSNGNQRIRPSRAAAATEPPALTARPVTSFSGRVTLPNNVVSRSSVTPGTALNLSPLTNTTVTLVAPAPNLRVEILRKGISIRLYSVCSCSAASAGWPMSLDPSLKVHVTRSGSG